MRIDFAPSYEASPELLLTRAIAAEIGYKFPAACVKSEAQLAELGVHRCRCTTDKFTRHIAGEP